LDKEQAKKDEQLTFKPKILGRTMNPNSKSEVDKLNDAMSKEIGRVNKWEQLYK
jgi:hypothetical protein